MPNPSLSDVRPDPIMTNVAVIQARTGNYLIDRLMPVIRVGADLFRYAKFDTSDLLMDTAIDRAIGAPANEVKMNLSYPTGTTTRSALKMPLPREIVSQSTNPSALDNRRTMVVGSRIKLGLEKRMRDLLVALTSAGTVSVKWDAASNVTIKKNLDAYKAVFRAQCGVEPNLMAMGYSVAKVVANDSDVLARQKSTTDRLVADGDLPPVLFNMQTAVGGAISQADPNSALADIWNTDDVWLAYVDPNGNEETMQFGAQFRAPAIGGAEVAAGKFPHWDTTANSDFYWQEYNQVEKVICSTAILRIADVLTT